MACRLRSHFRSNLVGYLALFVALGGTGAYAATNFVGGDGQIHGCVSKKGQLSVLKPGKKCGKGKSAIAWNQQGPRGFRGTRGKPGSNGATNVVVRTTTGDIDAGVNSGLPVPMCNPGERAVGGGSAFTFTSGGHTFHDVNGGDSIIMSAPVRADGLPANSGDTPAGWKAYIRNGDTSTRTATHYVLCESP